MSNKTSGWKILFRYLLHYKKDVIFLSVLGVFSALANASTPYLIGRFFDGLLNLDEVFTLYGYAFPVWSFFLSLWVFVELILNSTDWVNELKQRYIGTKINAEYAVHASSHLLTLPLSFHKENKHGEVWEKLNRAGNNLTNIIERIIINLAPQFLAVAIGVVFAYFISPLLASILVSGLFLYVVVLRKIVAPMGEIQRKGHDAWSKAYGVAYDAIANYQTVKQSSTEAYEKSRIKNSFLGDAFPLWFKMEKIWTAVSFTQRVIMFLTRFAVFIISVHLIRIGEISVGELIALNGYALIVFGPFVQLGFNWQVIQNGIIAIERAEEILSQTSENIGGGKVFMVEGGVEFKNLSFYYKKDEKKILDTINFLVRPGEVIAFVGKSGVGKSTVIDLISGYYFPQEGEVFIDGINTKEADLNALRKEIAVVPQEPVLFNDTIGMNIKYGNLNATEKEMKEAARKAHADVFIEEFPEKYEQLVGERGVKLSVGQKQRVAIARAILRNPKILILDEPTSALDPKTEQFIQNSLTELMEGRTTFIIAHRLSTTRRADRIFVLEQGKIVEEGNHENLIKIENGAYRKLYELHVGLT